MIKPKTRLYFEGLLEAGVEVVLGRDHLHFLRSVLRMNAGDTINLFNSVFGEWSVTLEELGKRRGVARINVLVRKAAPEAGPWLAFAPIKKTRTDFVIEKATELGVERVVPVFTKFTATSRVNVERLSAIATEAAEQCGRLSVPEIAEPSTLDQLVADWPNERILYAGDETGGGAALADVLSGGAAAKEHGFLIGPEGGFADDEINLLRAQEFCRLIDLGPRILRAETAAIMALGVSNALTGR
jgi:16S rRNA (uracil1498-N3)-methyltransferase